MKIIIIMLILSLRSMACVGGAIYLAATGFRFWWCFLLVAPFMGASYKQDDPKEIIEK